MKKLLITTCTHGDEQFSIPVVSKLAIEFGFDWQISNPNALKANKRFIDIDLNRSGPGRPNSKLYEERRAAKIINQAKKYSAVIDIHGTTSNSGIFIILSDPNWQNIELAKKLDIEKVVLWPSFKPTGPLTQFIPNSLEIECGPKNDPNIARQLGGTLKKFINKQKPTTAQRYFIVTGFSKGKPNPAWKEWQKAYQNNESFYPLMLGQYQGIACYTMQEIINPLL